MAPSSKGNPSNVLETLFESVAAIFDQVQLSVANHKKNCVALYKLHISTVDIKEPGKHGKRTKLIGERTFQDVFIDMISRVLVVKKGPATADKTIKYVGAFMKYMNEKAIEARVKAIEAAEKAGTTLSDEDEDTPTSRFNSRMLKWLSQGFVAKNKIVRFSEDAYNELRDGLIDRLNDKEVLVRTHATIALSKLLGGEITEEVPEAEQIIVQTLLETLSTDPAAEVRRAILLNIPLMPSTLSAVLSRTRDVDAVTRKLVYSSVLQVKLGHPRHLSIAQRELVVKDGLGDREPAVRVAAGKLVTSWYEMVLGEETESKKKKENEEGNEGVKEEETEEEPEKEKEKPTWVGDDAGVMKALVRFLGLFDVIGGEAVAADAVLSVFTTRPDLPDVFTFSEAFWKNLTPESATLARIFVEHCHSTENEARLESSSLPVVTAFAFVAMEAYNGVLGVLEEIETARLLQAGQEEENEELEEELAKREVILSELLKMALKFDYGDEIGRRKVFTVVKDMLAHPQLPPALIERCLDVLKEIMPSERDLIRVIVEIVVELREGEDDGENADEPPIDDNQSDVSQATIKKPRKKSRDDMTPEERTRADLTDVRCLMLCIAMLERVNGTFEDNSTLEGILGDLIIPCVKRKELAMREKALVSLGLCCLIAKNMALSSFQLFLSQAQNAPTELKIQVLKIIMDLLIMYDQEFFGRSEETAKQIVDFLLQILETEESAEAQAVIVTGLCKLLLPGIITETRVLTSLALVYISPATYENQELRQCLSYFFPVYSYSVAANQIRMSSVFMATFDLALRMHEELDDDQEMISPYQFGLLMIDWTDPQKSVGIKNEETMHLPHVNLAVEILVALYDTDRTVDVQKMLCQLLGQLQIGPGLDNRSIHKLNILLSNHEEQAPFENVAVEKIFDRFKNKFTTMFEKELKEIDPLQYADDEFIDLYQRIGVDAPEQGYDGKVRFRSKNKRGALMVEEEDEDDEEEEEGDEEEEVDEDEEEEAAEEEVGGNEAAEQEAAVVAEDEDAVQAPTEEDQATDKAEESEANNEEPEEAHDEESPANSPTPPPKRTRKPPARKAAAKPKGKAGSRSRKAAAVPEETESLKSDEENIPPPVEVVATPKKKKGVKRAHTPGSGQVTSPGNRKRTRVKAPLKSTKEVTSEEEYDSPSPSPAKPPARQTRNGKGKGRLVPIKEPTPQISSDEEEADEVADTLASPMLTPTRATATAASSDDFGGYSD
ncbi:Condensin complex subunit 3 [Psilocybe cubensis]|uniref:Condensin complex subunit 3 n=1 Tax=Psilocybe cubensis TaxID=181762 RepID=A0ACB8GT14_PSICU|nr:Condensin complex subunit 3 [Psilocybe cubensis]KAH9478497.1 Condensin complex subunit 3 [Psilocybe cubensis]